MDWSHGYLKRPYIVLAAILSDISEVWCQWHRFYLYFISERMSTTQQRRNDAGSCVRGNRSADSHFESSTGATVARSECSTQRKFYGNESSICGLFAPGNESAGERRVQTPCDQSCWERIFWPVPKNESALAGANRLVKDRSRKSGSIQNAP